MESLVVADAAVRVVEGRSGIPVENVALPASDQAVFVVRLGVKR